MSRWCWAFSLVAASAAIAACGDEEQVAPVSTGASGEGGSTTTTTSSSSSSQATSGSSSSSSTSSSGSGTPVREVFLRNPFGEQEGNLLADGGFELSVVSNSGQHGWIAFEDLVGETGGLCRSGLRCARMPREGILFARGTSAPGSAPLQVEIRVKPDGASDCSGIDLYVISCDSFQIRETMDVPSEPDEEGWCSIGGPVVGARTSTCLYLENNGDGDFLVDDASIRRDPAPPAILPDPPSITDIPAKTRANMQRLRERLRRTLPLGSLPKLPPGTKRPAHWPPADAE